MYFNATGYFKGCEKGEGDAVRFWIEKLRRVYGEICVVDDSLGNGGNNNEEAECISRVSKRQKAAYRIGRKIARKMISASR